MVLKYTLAWVPMVLLAVLNGSLRQFTYGKVLPEVHANQISVATGIALFSAYTWLLGRKWPLASSRQALAVGAVWLSLTLAFEFLFGRYVAGESWNALLHEYDVLAGRLWVLVPAAVLVLPVIVFKARH